MKKLLLMMLLPLVAGIANASVVAGKTYRIASVKNQNKALFVENSSSKANAPVVLWTDTDVPSQQWRAEENADGTFSFVNVFTGKSLCRSTASDISKLTMSQTGAESSRKKWIVHTVAGGENRYELRQVISSKTYVMKIDSESDGTSPGMRELTGTEAGEDAVWILEEVTPISAFNDELRSRMMSGWLGRHLRDRGAGLKSFGDGGWGEAEMLETVLDAFETSGNKEYLDVFRQVFAMFYNSVGANWDILRYDDVYKWYGHDFNDDVMWMIIASARAYHLTGEKKYHTYAKHNFDIIYNRAYNQWGMLRWAENSGHRNGTNSCVNGPAEVAACYIAMGCDDEAEKAEYYDKARKLYDNQRRYLFNAHNGRVYDSFTWNESDNTPGSYNHWVSTYNQGTMLGAALLLYSHYGDEMYKSDAEAIVSCTKDDLCNADGIISVCQNVDGDLCGFKGILMRYLRRYIVTLRHPEDVAWIQDNAMMAYSNRNSSGITSSAWLSKSGENWLSTTERDGNGNFKNFGSQPFGNSTAVSAAFNAPLYASHIVKDAFSQIPAGWFDYLGGVYVEDGEVTEVADGGFTIFSNVNFGSTPARSVELTLNGAGGGNVSIDILAGGKDGKLLGTLGAPSGEGTSTVRGAIVPTDGICDICLVYRADGASKGHFKVSAMQFMTDDMPLPADLTDGNGELSATGLKGNLSALTDNRATTCVKAEGSSVSLTYTLPQPALLKWYVLGNGADEADADPSELTLYGSADGNNWTELDRQTGVTFDARSRVKRFDIALTKQYTSFRLDVKGENGAIALGEWQLHGLSLAADDITADGGKLMSGESALIDKSVETKAMAEPAKPIEINYAAAGTYAPAYYSITASGAALAPAGWALYGMSGVNWVELDRRENAAFAGDGCTQFFRLEKGGQFQKFRLVTDPAEGATEIAEFQLFGQLSTTGGLYADITAGCGELTTSAGVGDASALIDKEVSTTFTLPFDGSAWVQYHSEIPAVVKSCRIVAGFDKSKNPSDWVLEGSRDGKTWTSLATGSNISFANLGDVRAVIPNNNNAFYYFRVKFTKISGSGIGEIEIGELQLHGQCVSRDDIIAKGGSKTSAVPGANSNEGLQNLFDGNANSKYCFNFFAGAWVAFEPETPACVNLYSLTSGNDNVSRNPVAWELQGSDDGTDWTVLDRRDNEAFFGYNITQFYPFANDKAYAHYRLAINENNGDALSQFSEFQLFHSDKAGGGIETVAAAPADMVSYDRADGSLHVSVRRPALLTVCNAQGAVVLTRQLTSGVTVVPAEYLADGLYVAVVAISSASVATKFVKF